MLGRWLLAGLSWIFDVLITVVSAAEDGRPSSVSGKPRARPYAYAGDFSIWCG
jgi:hypothetical protein